MSKQNADSRISVSKQELGDAGKLAGLIPAQTEFIWKQLSELPAPAGSISVAQVAWYFGAAVVLFAMTWLLTIIGDVYGQEALLGTILAYTGFFVVAGSQISKQEGLRVPSGLLYVIAAVLTPATVMATEQIWHWSASPTHATLMAALATVGVSALLTWHTRISFVILPALIAGWVAVNAGTDLIFGWNYSMAWEIITVAYGAVVLLGSLFLDERTDEDYSFWGYLIGSLAVYSGLTVLDKSGAGYLLYAGLGLSSMLVSVLLARKVFAFAGAAAVLTYLGHLSFIVFANSVLFPVVLTAMGCATIYGGVLYHRHSASLEAAILGLLPEGLRKRLPR